MKRYFIIIFLLLILFSCCNQKQDYNSLEADLNKFIDEWHQAAAVANEDVFFGSLDSNAVYLGTDPTERWLKHEFMDWGLKYFKRDTAWAFEPYNRNWEFTTEFNYAWFDELLQTHMGICRGSGVVYKTKLGWKIKHYNLAITISNEKMKDFIKIQDISQK